MKIIGIIAVVFVLLIPINVFADHEPNPYDAWHQGCQDSYDQQVYIDGKVTQQMIDWLEGCKNQLPYPQKPPFVSDCNTLRDYEYEKLGRAVEVHGYDESHQQQLAEGIERQHEICMNTAITPEQVKCYVELDTLVYNHDLIEEQFRTGTDGVEHWIGEKDRVDYFKEALHHYDSCMGFENEESQKLIDRLESALYYKACYELPHRVAEFECFDSHRHITLQQGWELLEEVKDCGKKNEIARLALTQEQRSSESAEEAQVLSDLIQCFNDILLTLEPEPIVQPTQKAQPTSESIACGTGTILKDGLCVPEHATMTTEMQQKSSNGGGCLIATATFGSELSSQVQQLREIRDNSLLQTESGRTFMESFNQFYYSFSPEIADLERENPVFKEVVKLTLTPLLSSLSLLNYVDMDSEAEVLGYGISIILLNVGMYFVLPAVVIHRVRKFVYS